MNKLQFAEAISEETELSPKEALAVMDVVFSALIKSLVTGKTDKVSITGLGIFERVWRKPRMSRNPQTGDRIRVEGYWMVVFRPGKAFKDMMRGTKELPVGRSAASKAPKTVKPKAAVSEDVA